MISDEVQREADRFANGIAESTLENVFEENGRFSGFVAATEWEGDEYYIKYYSPEKGDDPLLVHKETGAIFQADVWVSLSPTGDYYYAPSDQSEEAVAERAKIEAREEKRAARIKRDSERLAKQVAVANAPDANLKEGYL